MEVEGVVLQGVLVVFGDVGGFGSIRTRSEVYIDRSFVEEYIAIRDRVSKL